MEKIMKSILVYEKLYQGCLFLCLLFCVPAVLIFWKLDLLSVIDSLAGFRRKRKIRERKKKKSKRKT